MAEDRSRQGQVVLDVSAMLRVGTDDTDEIADRVISVHLRCGDAVSMDHAHATRLRNDLDAAILIVERQHETGEYP